MRRVIRERRVIEKPPLREETFWDYGKWERERETNN